MNVSCFVSYDPGYQRSLRELKPSTRQRFIGLTFGYPAESQEIEIIAAETGVEKGVAKRIVSIGTKIRGLVELSLLETVSTRLLVAAGRLIRAGVLPRLACFSAIAEPVSDDADALGAMRQVIELGI
jgi:nitric oxide reductase NorQ protein